ncbi:RNA 2',3'-cyclic phosphodiesterase [Nocardiopsis mangrovi]|uniref:RNA 2',3'-cyclic phosphodiesterase n=1 Tax=Nocardiopsis mangrovi TaxID=1179818 RepID=A0ABV9DXV4_9ACTN
MHSDDYEVGMKLFVELQPPPEVLEDVAAAVSALPPVDGLHPSSREEWHVTLVFLGEVPDDTAEGLRERLAAEAARHPPLRLAVRGAGTFPGDTARANVLWAGIEGDLEGLSALVAGLRRAARKSGLRVERRAHVPHLTLARSGPPMDLGEQRTALAGLGSPFWTAEDIRLMHSRPGEEPRYRTVATWRLG